MASKDRGMQYEVHSTPLKDGHGNNYLCVKPRSFHTRTIADLDDYCARHFSVRPGEMTQVLMVLRQALSTWLAWGDRIETPIGTFAPRLGLSRERTTADELSDDDVFLKGISFEPAKDFVEEVERATGGYRKTTLPSSLPLVDDENSLLSALRKAIDINGGYATVTSFRRYSHLSVYSARQVLDRWCEEPRPKLQRSKLGHIFIYTEI